MRQVIRRGKIRERLLRLGAERASLSERIRTNQLRPDDQFFLLFVIRILPWCIEKLRKRTFLVGKLKDMLWGKKSECARDILDEINQDAQVSGGSAEAKPNSSAPECSAASGAESETKASPAPNNVIPINSGKRNYPKNRKSSKRGQAAYPDATPITIKHQEFRSGDSCPKCEKGRIYDIKMGVYLLWLAHSMLEPQIYLQQKLRCNGCGWITAAKMPPEVVDPNGSPAASAMIAVLKYGCGFPFFRLSKLQGWLRMPISPSSLWNQLKRGLIEVVEIVWKEMRKIAAQGDVVHNDDTVNKVLALMEKKPKGKDPRIPKGVLPDKKPRTAVSTTGILSKTGDLRILLFFTGHANAGENLEELLKERERCLKPPIQMSDASTMNRPGDEKVEASLCLTHGRRGFICSVNTHILCFCGNPG